MSDNQVTIPLRELTPTQLIGVIHRLQDEIAEFYRKSDAEVRRENQRIWVTMWEQGGELETIAEMLISAGYPDTRRGQMAHSIRQLVQQLRNYQQQHDPSKKRNV